MISRVIDNQHLLVKCTRVRDVCDDAMEISRPRKRVRISMQEPTVHRYEVPTSTNPAPTGDCEKPKRQTNRTWLTPQELGYFRSCAKKLCRSVYLDDVLQEAYHGAVIQNLGDISIAEVTSALASNEDYIAQRGLERWSSTQHSILRSMTILQVKSEVLLEQTSQILSGRFDPSRLAQASLEASKSSQQFAQLLGLADASMAMQIRHEAISRAA